MSQTLNLISEDHYITISATLPYDLVINYNDSTQLLHSANSETVIDNVTISNELLYIAGPSKAISSVSIDSTVYDFSDPLTIEHIAYVGATSDELVSNVDSRMTGLILHRKGEFQ